MEEERKGKARGRRGELCTFQNNPFFPLPSQGRKNHSYSKSKRYVQSSLV